MGDRLEQEGSRGTEEDRKSHRLGVCRGKMVEQRESDGGRGRGRRRQSGWRPPDQHGGGGGVWIRRR